MTGGDGDDRFILINPASGSATADVITDFAEGDKLVFAPGTTAIWIERVFDSNNTWTGLRVYAEAGGKSPLVLLDGWGKGLLSRHLENVDSDIKLHGWSDNDTIHGGGGDDKIYGGYGDDLLYGDADNDLVVGNYGNDTLHGGSGNDRLYGNTGDDKLYGEAGNDVLVGGAGKDYLDGGTGADILSYSGSTSAVHVDLGAKTATGGHATGDKFVNLEHLFGSDHNDRLTGDTGANVISGGKGGDILIGGGGGGSAVWR